MKSGKFKKILVSTDMDLLGEIMNITGETNKTAVFHTALEEYCRKVRRDKLISMEGSIDTIGLNK